MPKPGFTTITMRVETEEKTSKVRTVFQPNMSANGFQNELLDFYVKYHCPKCGECTAIKIKIHKC